MESVYKFLKTYNRHLKDMDSSTLGLFICSDNAKKCITLETIKFGAGSRRDVRKLCKKKHLHYFSRENILLYKIYRRKLEILTKNNNFDVKKQSLKSF